MKKDKRKIEVLRRSLENAEMSYSAACEANEAELAETIKQEVQALQYAIKCCNQLQE